MPPTWIAEEPFIFVHPNGDRMPGRIAIGKPHVTPEGDARCPMALDGCWYVGKDVVDKGVFGDNPLQALFLAMSLAGQLMHDFLERGGRVLDPQEEVDVPLDAYFGPLLRSVAVRADG
jgi:hypothetical protein